MTGLELIAAAAVGYLVRKARRVGVRADAEVDRALDAGMDALHQAVSTALGEDSSLILLNDQLAAGTETERTQQRVRLAIEQAAADDSGFAGQLYELVTRLQALEEGTAGNVQTGYGASAGRDVRVHAESGGVAAVNMDKPVIMSGNPPVPGPGGT